MYLKILASCKWVTISFVLFLSFACSPGRVSLCGLNVLGVVKSLLYSVGGKGGKASL